MPGRLAPPIISALSTHAVASYGFVCYELRRELRSNLRLDKTTTRPHADAVWTQLDPVTIGIAVSTRHMTVDASPELGAHDYIYKRSKYAARFPTNQIRIQPSSHIGHRRLCPPSRISARARVQRRGAERSIPSGTLASQRARAVAARVGIQGIPTRP